jgi:hypothetical protein
MSETSCNNITPKFNTELQQILKNASFFQELTDLELQLKPKEEVSINPRNFEDPYKVYERSVQQGLEKLQRIENLEAEFEELASSALHVRACINDYLNQGLPTDQEGFNELIRQEKIYYVLKYNAQKELSELSPKTKLSKNLINSLKSEKFGKAFLSTLLTVEILTMGIIAPKIVDIASSVYSNAIGTEELERKNHKSPLYQTEEMLGVKISIDRLNKHDSEEMVKLHNAIRKYAVRVGLVESITSGDIYDHMSRAFDAKKIEDIRDILDEIRTQGIALKRTVEKLSESDQQEAKNYLSKFLGKKSTLERRDGSDDYWKYELVEDIEKKLGQKLTESEKDTIQATPFYTTVKSIIESRLKSKN